MTGGTGCDRRVGLLLGVATAAQAVGVVALGRLPAGIAVQVVVAGLAIAVAVTAAWRVRLRLDHRVDMLLVMGALGGLGMLAGWWVDLGFEAPSREASFHAAMGHCGEHGESAMAASACCATGEEGVAAAEPEPPADVSGRIRAALDRIGLGMAWTWMTALMLAAAIPAGALWTRCAELASSSVRRWVSTHVVGNLAMVVGMIWIGHAIGPPLAAALGSNVLGAHLAMVAGMLVGMEAGMWLGEAALGLAPWREWRRGASGVSSVTAPPAPPA